MSEPLTRAMLDRAMQQALNAPRQPTMYIVPPNRLREARIALAYLHGFITRAEYRRLFYIEQWLKA